MYDVGIVGAGPAGSTLARFLADRYRVLLLDSGRTKCCGGILAPEAQKMLAKFDLAVPKGVLVHPQPQAVAVLDLQSRLVRHYARRYLNIDRRAFDRWLISLVPGTVDVCRNAIYRSSRVNTDDDFVEIRFVQGGETHIRKVRWLVGADGPFSTVRREHFSDRVSPKRYLAIQHWFDRESHFREAVFQETKIDFTKDYVGIFDSEITDFYAWSIPKDEYIVLGAAIPAGENTRGKFELLQSKFESLGLQLNHPARREAGQLLRPLAMNSMNPGSKRVILVGEAAGLISPSSAEGIGAALDSAWQLYRAFGSGAFDLLDYRRNIRRLRWNLWLKMVKIPIMFNPCLRKCVMLSGLTSLQIAPNKN